MCTSVSDIHIKEDRFDKDDICYEDIEIYYKPRNESSLRKGYLRNQNIITQVSSRIKCNSNIQKEIIIDNKLKITKFKNKISYKNYTSNVVKLITRNKKLKNLFQHHNYLTNGTDMIEDLSDMIKIINGDESVISNNESSYSKKLIDESKFLGYFNGFNFNIFLNMLNYFKNVLIIFLFFFAIIHAITFCFPNINSILIKYFKKLINIL